MHGSTRRRWGQLPHSFANCFVKLLAWPTVGLHMKTLGAFELVECVVGVALQHPRAAEEVVRPPIAKSTPVFVCELFEPGPVRHRERRCQLHLEIALLVRETHGNLFSNCLKL